MTEIDTDAFKLGMRQLAAGVLGPHAHIALRRAYDRDARDIPHHQLVAPDSDTRDQCQ